MQNDESDLAQAYRMLAALQDYIDHLSQLMETAEIRRRPTSRATDSEKVMRRDLYEAHRYVDRLHERFPETRVGRTTK